MDDRAYFADRVNQEHDVGDSAATSQIAAIHYELAYRYALLCSDDRSDVIPFLKRV